MSRTPAAGQAPTTTVGALPGPVSDLLAAIRDALDVPLADRPVDDVVRAELLTRRAADTRVIVELLLTHGDVERSAARLREWTAEHPVSYAPWKARTDQSAAEEEGLLDAEPASAPEPLYGGDVDQFIADAYDSLADSDMDDERPRCPAAHSEDPDLCTGPVVVTIIDATNAGADGCEHHAARLLASLDGGRVYGLPDAPEGAAIRVHKAADSIRPFPWVSGPRTRPGQLSRAEVRERGEGE